MEVDDGATSFPAAATSAEKGPQPVCLIVLGMAGSGKTTFVQVLYFDLPSQRFVDSLLTN